MLAEYINPAMELEMPYMADLEEGIFKYFAGALLPQSPALCVLVASSIVCLSSSVIALCVPELRDVRRGLSGLSV